MGVWMMWWRRFIRGICFEEISEGEPRCRCGGGVILDEITFDIFMRTIVPLKKICYSINIRGRKSLCELTIIKSNKTNSVLLGFL